MIKNCFIKIIIVFVIISAFYKPASSQAYIPIPLDSTIWKVTYWAALPWPYSWQCSIFEYTAGDTVINSKNYTLIKTLYDPFCLTHIPQQKKAAIRQDSLARKVFIIWLPDSLTERVLYDFTQTVGDTCNSVLGSSLCAPTIVQSIDSVLVNNRFHRRLNLYGNCCMASLIEGVGSTYGLIDKLFAFENGNELMCVHDFKNGDKTIFPDSTTRCDTSSVGITENYFKNYETTIYPNPFTTYVTFEFPETLPDINLSLYDVYSRLLRTTNALNTNKIILQDTDLPKGIYFYRLTSKSNIINTGKVIKN